MGNSHIHPITKWLASKNPCWLTLYCSISAFCLYTSVYAFRKAFPAATFEGYSYLNIDFKVWLVVFQSIGYGLSKFIGIKWIAELQHKNRKQNILILILIAGISWLLFAIVPKPYNITLLFFNGLSLGMIWGVIFSYLEGRRVTDVLGAALSISFIFSSGMCRSVGAMLIQVYDVPEMWMPFVACVLFTIPLLLFSFCWTRCLPLIPRIS